MNHVRTWVGLAFASALGGLVAFALLRTDRAVADTPLIGSSPRTAVGSAGCSGAACHGRPIRGDLPSSAWGTDLARWKTSYDVWRLYDPHARAYRVLIDGEPGELSAAIERKLTPHGGTTLNAWEDARCLACHSNPTLAGKSGTEPTHAEGVSCEACHGNATRYLYDHVGWVPGPDHREKYAAVGMTDLSDPAARAETCARCHVGAPAANGAHVRDMSHDLIAAGHPRLSFDYATYVRALPPHWTEKDRSGPITKARPAAEIAHHWVVGRAATTAVACELLADRAAGAARKAPWPELSEFDCYACHHNLKSTVVPDPDHFKGRSPGSLVWNEPVFAGELIGLAGNAALAGAHKTLRDRMHGRRDPAAVADEAKAATAAWRAQAVAWAAGRPLSTVEIAAGLKGMRVRRWDDAAHGYYALRALDAARGVENDPKLKSLRTTLRLPRGDRNSPADFDADRKPLDLGPLFGKRR